MKIFCSPKLHSISPVKDMLPEKEEEKGQEQFKIRTIKIIRSD